MTEADLLSDIDPVLRRRESNGSDATFAVRAYLAGPMRKISEFNFAAFDAAAARLRAAGYEVWSPAEHDRANGFDPTGMTGHEDLSEYGFSLRDALVRDMTEVARSDFVCLLDGWENSMGAKAERALAEALWIQTGTLEEYLPAEPLTEHEFLTGDLPMHEYHTGLEALGADGLWSSAAVAGAIAARIGLHGPCERRDRHDPHIETSGITDNGGNIVLDQCPGQTADCANCDDRKCMSCVFREPHDECCDDCPDCCNVEAILPVDRDGGFATRSPHANLFWDHDSNEVRITSSTGGQKGTKLARFDLIPTRPWWAVAELFGYGTKKYEDRNWERGYAWSLSYAAMQRHANLFWSREDNDVETGLPHLSAVVFHALALMEYRTTHPEFDDRPGR